MVVALILGLIVSAPTPSRSEGEFYVVTKECTTTVAGLQSDRGLSSVTKVVDPAEIKRCARVDDKVRCYAQLDVGGRLSDHPTHAPDENEVVSNADALLQLHGEGRSWMTVNVSTGTVASGVLANSPAAAAAQAIEAIVSMVCRGIIAAPDDLRRLKNGK